MNIDELATNVARDIAEYEKAAGGDPFWYVVVSDKAPVVNKAIRNLEIAEEYAAKSSDIYPGVRIIPLYARPDPRVAELEAQIAALLVAIEAKDAALEKIACIGNGDSHGNSIGNCMAIEALALSPSAELLEARDRVRDAKLLRAAEEASDDDGYPVDIWKLADARESGEWKPELGD